MGLRSAGREPVYAALPAHGYEPFLYARQGAEMLRSIPKDDPHQELAQQLIAALEGLPELDWDLIPKMSLIQEFINRK